MVKLERVLQFYDAALSGEPQSEFLLNGVTNSDPIALLIAKCAYPDVFADVDATQAVSSLLQEETGSAPAGRFYFPDL